MEVAGYMVRDPSKVDGRSRSGAFVVVAGIATAAIGAYMTSVHTAIVGPILLLVGLALFGFGLLMR
jgi:hypothetical protein